MKISIVDACFPIHKQSSGLAALWLKWHIPRCGGILVQPSEAELFAFTCVTPDNWRICKKLKKSFPQIPIVAGGAGALSPFTVGKYADVVCVGDGQRFIKILCQEGLPAAKKLPEAWVDGDDRLVDIALGFPWDFPPAQAEDGAFRVWCGRGCKKRCAFCETGWALKYQENPWPSKLLRVIKNLQSRGEKVAFLSNDPQQHSFFRQLPTVEHGSYSLDYIKRNGIPAARHIRLGVEGVSERLRRLVFKPVDQDELIKASIWIGGQGKSLRWFMIAGLPGETTADWEELKGTLLEWKKYSHRGVLGVSFTTWIPSASTPLGVFPLKDDYWENWQDFKEWFFGGVGWSNRIKLMNPKSPPSRMETSMATMGLSMEQLRMGGLWGPNDRVNYPDKEKRNKLALKIAEKIKKEAYS